MLTQLRSTQTNLSEGYKPKVQRLRESEGKQGAGKDKAAPAKAIP
jgi:hypothetical protein